MDFVFGGDPEELMEKMREAHEQHKMVSEDFNNQLKSLFEDISIDNLVTLRTLFSGLTHLHPAALSGIISYYEGMLVGILQFKHNVCASCGVNHEEDAAASMLTPPDKPVGPDPVEAIPMPSAEPSNALSWSAPAAAQMIRYRVELTGEGEQVRCTDCGLRYPNLEDRMLREPDSCHGCFQMAKDGSRFA